MNSSRLIQAFGMVLCIAACSDGGGGNETSQAGSPAKGPGTDAAPCELVMGWDPWEPYQYEIAGGQVLGLDVDLLTAVASHAGCDLSFRKGSWRDLLQLLEAGDIDLLAGATRTPDREAFAYFTEPYRDEQFSLFVAARRLDELGDKGFGQLMDAGLRFGVVQDYLYGDPVATFQDDPRFEDRFVYTSMSETNLSRLLTAQVDAVIEDKYVGASIIRHKDLGSDIAPHPMAFTSNPVSIMVSRASVDEAQFQELNAMVTELRASGAIDKVLAQYLYP
jgi:polar amino acid transport system substrate-binding protein